MQPPLLPFPGDIPVLTRPPLRRFKRTEAWPRRLVRRLGLFLPVLAAAILGAGSFLVLTKGGHDVRTSVNVQPAIERIARIAGFSIDEVRLAGHAFTADADIYDALDLGNVRAFWDLDTAAVRARIERLPWVDTANLTRVFPGRLDVEITERTPFAIWQRGSQDWLVDRSGRVLSQIKPGSITDLPRLEGEGTNKRIAALMGLLGRFSAFKGRMVKAEWVSDRRWTFHLTQGVVLHLPSDREASALSLVDANGGLARLIAQPGRTIDLRGPNRIAIRQVGAAKVQELRTGSGS